MALVSANQFSLVPDLGRSIAQGQQIGSQFRAGQQARQAQARNTKLGQFSGQALSGDPSALTQVANIDPGRAIEIQKFLGSMDEAKRNEIIRENESLTRGALDALSLPPQNRRSFVQKERERFRAEGRDTSNVDLALSGNDEQLDQFLTIQARQGQSLKDLTDRQFPKAVQDKPVSPLDQARTAKLQAETAEIGKESTGDVADRSLRERQITVSEQSLEERSSKLSAGLEKALLTAQDATVIAQRSANEFDVLAGDFDRRASDLQGGAVGTFTEFLKATLGTQDDVTEFRRRFNKVRLSEGLKSLPPGPATDRDVIEAFKGVPKDNASPEQVSSFLRGAARLARFDAGFNQFKSDFISKNSTAKGLNRAWRKQVVSPVLNRKVSLAEIYETAQNRSLTPEEVIEKLGLSDAGLI